MKTILKASKISFVPESLYHYRNDNPNSISNTRLSKIHDIFSIIDIVEDFLKSEDLFEDFKDEFDFFKIYQIIYQMQGRPNEYFNIAKKELSEVNINNDYMGKGLRFKLNSILNSQSIEEYNYKLEIYRLKSKNVKLSKEIKQLKVKNTELEKENNNLKKENDEILSSNSWKLTKILRKKGKLFK